MTDFLFNPRLMAVLTAGALVSGCGSSSPVTKADYKSDSKSKDVSLAVPPDMIGAAAKQRSLSASPSTASLADLRNVERNAAPNEAGALPAVGMRIQRDGTESWLVVDQQTPVQIWPKVRRFWQAQGFLLVIDQRDKGVLETDWNETRAHIKDGLVRGVISKALGAAYVTAERNKYRTRLDAAPNGGTYVFISQKGMSETLTGPNRESTRWESKPNDPALEAEYLKRLMAALAGDGVPARPDAVAAAQEPEKDEARTNNPSATIAAVAAQNVARSTQSNATDEEAIGKVTEVTLREPYDRAWLRVGLALDRANFTVDDRDRGQGLYFVRYVDPKDLSAAEQGFWNQLFHGKKEKAAKQYRINVKEVGADQIRVSIMDDKDAIDASPPAGRIMELLARELR